jgi:hypothetical protein
MLALFCFRENILFLKSPLPGEIIRIFNLFLIGIHEGLRRLERAIHHLLQHLMRTDIAEAFNMQGIVFQ